MGLKTINYKINKNNLELPTAYAKLGIQNIDKDGRVTAYFNVHIDRESIDLYETLETIQLQYQADKTLPLWEQTYTKAKEEVFIGWEDDILS